MIYRVNRDGSVSATEQAPAGPGAAPQPTCDCWCHDPEYAEFMDAHGGMCEMCADHHAAMRAPLFPYEISRTVIPDVPDDDPNPEPEESQPVNPYSPGYAGSFWDRDEYD